MARRIFIVPSYHYDVAYLKSYDEYLPGCFAILDEALRLLELHPEYHYMAEQVIILEEYWRARPDQRAALRRLAGEGRFTVAPGQWVMPDMNHPSGETMFLQNRIGKEWLREHLEIEPKVCWIADCWGHHAQLPQIMRQSGYDFYVFWRSMRAEFARGDFHWRGLDGTPIKTHWLSRGYGNIRFPDEGEIVNAADLNFWGASPKAIEDLCVELGQYGDEFDPTLLCNGGDMFLPQAGAPAAVKQLNGAGMDLRFSGIQEYLDAVAWEGKPEWRGEFNGLFEGSYTTNIRIKQRSRQMTNRLLDLETLAVAKSRGDDFTELWKPILKQQFHDIICGTITDKALEDCHREFDEAEQMLDEVQEGFAADEPSWFNPLSFARTEVVEHGGRRVRINLPAFGSTSVAEAGVLPVTVAAELPMTWENEFYRASIGENGTLTGLWCKRSERELIPVGHKAGFGLPVMQLDYGDSWLNFESPLNGGSLQSSLAQNNPDPLDAGDPNQLVNRGTFYAKIQSATVESGGDEELIVRQSGEVSFWRLRQEFQLELTMRRGSARLEYRMEMMPRGKHYRVRAAFPTTLVTGIRRDEIPFGIQEGRTGEQVAQNWFDWSDAQGGLAVVNRGTPGANVDTSSGEGAVLLLTLFRSAAMEYKCESTGSFNEGVPHVFEYAVVPHTGNYSSVIREGMRFNHRPVACGELENQAWAVAPEHVFVSGMRPRHEGVFLRLYEGTGKEAAVSLKVPDRFSRWCRADGLENPVEGWREISGRVESQLRGWEVAGILLR